MPSATETRPQQPLSDFVRELSDALASTLISVVQYGDSVKPGRAEMPSLPVHVMIVLKAIDTAHLVAIAAALANVRRWVPVAPLALTRHDLETSVDVFPIKFLDMQHHRRLLHGEDVLAGLTISEKHLRLRCEQEIKNLSLRLRRFFIEQSGDDTRLRLVLGNATGAFLRTCEAWLKMRSQKSMNSLDDVAAEIASVVDADPQTLTAANRVRRGDETPAGDELRDLYGRFMRLVSHTADVLDRSETASPSA